jgi:hypothetical protein
VEHCTKPGVIVFSIVFAIVIAGDRVSRNPVQLKQGRQYGAQAVDDVLKFVRGPVVIITTLPRVEFVPVSAIR